MNKLLQKVAKLFLGLSLAAGVGVAIGSKKEVSSVSAADSTFVSANQGWTNQQNLGTSVTKNFPDSNVSVTFNKGSASTNPTYYTSGGLRIYAKGNFVVSCSAGNLTAITLTYTQSNSCTTDVGTYSNKSWTGNASAVTFTVGGTSGHIRLSQIAATYSASKTLSSISVSGYETDFTVGDTFSFGGTVTAHYSNSTTANVTSSATFSGYNMSTAGNQTVTASYTEGGVTKTATYSITVSAPTTPSISLSGSSFTGYTGQAFSVTATYANLTGDFAWSTSGAGTTTETITSTGDKRDGTSTYSGTLTGAGIKTISATGGGASSQSYTVNITKTTVDITKASTSIPVGRSETLAASHNASGVGGLNWTSSNDSVATVDSAGKVTIANGATVGTTVTITATSSVDTSVSDTCIVTVATAPLDTTYDFVTHFSDYNTGWTNSYTEHTGINGKTQVGGAYTATIDLYYASKQTGTITDRPVMASKTASGSWAKVVGFELTQSGYVIDEVQVTFSQWGTKTPDIALFSGDEASGTPLDSGTVGTKNTISTSSLNVKTFTVGYCDKNTGSNVQAGLTSIYISLKEVTTLSSISLSGTYPDEFVVDDVFSHEGMVVTANYNNIASKNVTASATWSTPDMSTAGSKTITVSYSDEYGSASTTYTITVSPPSTPYITPDKLSTSGFTGANEILTFTYGNLAGILNVTSSSTSIVTVETPSISAGNGSVQINFVGVGQTTVKFKDGSTELASVSVSVAAASVTITGLPSTDEVYIQRTLNLGSTITVTATGSYTDSVSWSSSAPLIATVDSSSGVVTGVAEGSAVITVTSTSYPSATMSCTVTVSEAPLEYQVIFGTAEGTSAISDFSNTSYVIPSEVTLNNIQGDIYSNTSNQAASLRLGKNGTTGSFDASITGDYYIVSVKCNLKYYGSDTTATFSVTPDGGSAISKTMTSDWADYTYDVSSAKVKKVTLGTDITSKRAYLSGFTITYAVLKTLSNIQLSGTYPTSFNKGDTFSHSGMVVTANYNTGESANVTSESTFTGYNMSSPGNQTVTVSYSDEFGSASTTYSIVVSYANPEGITLSPVTSTTISIDETYDLKNIIVTINPSVSADQSEYEWVVYNDGGYTEGTDFDFDNDLIFWGYNACVVVLRCQSTKTGYSSSVYADFTITVSGDPIAHLLDSENVEVTDGSESVYSDVGDITYHITTEHFEGTMTYTWSSGDNTIASIDSDNGSSCDFYVEGKAGTVRLSCRVQGSVKGDVTVYIDVTVVAAQVNGVTWNAPTIDVFSGSSLTSSDTSSWNVRVSYDSGTSDVTPSSFNVKLGGTIISLPHTWVAADDGKTLCVEVDGVSSTTTTVAVTQSINSVTAPTTDAWDYTFESKQFSAEGSVTLDGHSWTQAGTGNGYWGYEAARGQQFGSGGNPYSAMTLTCSDFSGTIDSVTVYTSGGSGINANVQVSVGGTSYGSAQTITTSNAGYKFDLGGKSGNIVISWSQSSSKALYVKEIVVNVVSGSSNIANSGSHKAAQRAAVAFAQAFNAAMDTTENCTTGLDAAWSTCSSAYTSFKNAAAALGSTEEAYALNLVKYATAQYSDDSAEACIERMMKTYEICVNKHGKTAFMSDLVSVSAPHVSPIISIGGEKANSVAIIVIISMVSVTAIGGYFFLRKRKENI